MKPDRDETTGRRSEPEWRVQWRGRIRSLAGLHDRLRRRGIPAPTPSPGPRPAFPLRVTPYYADLIRRADPSDPIYRQCVPGPEETGSRTGSSCSPDPFGETAVNRPVPGIIRRYRDRAVLVAANACAVHCRHCTRRHALGHAGFPAARPVRVRSWLARETDLREVIISGGDPLSLSDSALERVLRCAWSAPHIERVRIGTRMPVVLPHRITRALASLLGKYGPVWVATHFNHPTELTAAAAHACATLVDAGLPVINQTVLLRGVNDQSAVLRELFLGLVNMRVRPYYLLHGDPVDGIGHFRVPVEKGLSLMDGLRAEITGLALPVYAADVPGATGKVPLSAETVLGRSPCGGLCIRLPGGGKAIIIDPV